MNDIGLVADHGQINEKQFSKFLDGILSKDLAAKIFSCFDTIDNSNGYVSLPAVHRFVTGRSKVGKREKEIVCHLFLHLCSNCFSCTLVL